MDLTLRLEAPEDYDEVEALTREAFWNEETLQKKGVGCDEHFLAFKMRGSALFVPQLAYVALLDGRIVGSILYTGSKVVQADGSEVETLIFGPLSVLPPYQKQGVGSALVRHTVAEAARLGYRAILIFGHPEYYPRLGFQNAAVFDITTAKGENFDAFMALELYPGALQGVSGRYFYDPVYDEVVEDGNLDELRQYDRRFPPRG